MQAEGLGADQQRRDVDGVLGAGHVDLAHLGAQVGEHVGDGMRVLAAIDGSTSSKKNVAGSPTRRPAHAGVQPGQRVVERVLDRPRVERGRSRR